MVFFLSLATRIDADFDEEEDVDIEGYDDDESTSQSYTKKESFGSQQLLGSEQDSQEMSQFESILLDLQHSESESEEDDFPFGDGDDEDEEDIEEEEQISFSPGGDESNEAIKEELTEDLWGSIQLVQRISFVFFVDLWIGFVFPAIDAMTSAWLQTSRAVAW